MLLRKLYQRFDQIPEPWRLCTFILPMAILLMLPLSGWFKVLLLLALIVDRTIYLIYR